MKIDERIVFMSSNILRVYFFTYFVILLQPFWTAISFCSPNRCQVLIFKPGTYRRMVFILFNSKLHGPKYTNTSFQVV